MGSACHTGTARGRVSPRARAAAVPAAGLQAAAAIWGSAGSHGKARLLWQLQMRVFPDAYVFV